MAYVVLYNERGVNRWVRWDSIVEHGFLHSEASAIEPPHRKPQTIVISKE